MPYSRPATFDIGSLLLSGTPGSVLFVGTGPALAQDNANFRWDNTNNQLLLGQGSISSPPYSFAPQSTTGLYLPVADRLGFVTGGTEQFRIGNQTSSVDFLLAIGARAIDAGPVLAIDGTTADRDLTLRAKGIGAHRFTTGTGTSENFRVSPFAGVATEFFQAIGASAGLAAGSTLSAPGHATINSGGVGTVLHLQAQSGGGSGGEIQWNRALVALGGGVAPTFGTIGGAGPAVAAQNSWLRVLDSTGTATFIPVWK